LEYRIKIPDWLDGPFVRLALLYRRIRFGYPFRRIPLTQGKYAIVDPDDYERLSRHKWHLQRTKRIFYALRRAKGPERTNGQAVWMHRYIFPPPQGMCIDHINNNGLDNRKANLRLATPAQNARNRRKTAAKTYSKYKGVSYHAGQRKWSAAIRVNGQYKYFGLFKNEIDAAKAYDRAARKHHKEFAVLNFPAKYQIPTTNDQFATRNSPY
jgi:hypothetical protein